MCWYIFSYYTISAKGIFVFDLDTSKNTITNLETKKFGQDLIELGFNENQIRKFRRGMANKEEWDPFDYILSDIKVKSNDEKYLVAKQSIN